MKYLLDTNICIALLRHDPAASAVFRYKRKEGVGISAIVLAELEYGVHKSRLAVTNRSALLHFLSTLDVLPFDQDAACTYGEIVTGLYRHGQPIGPMDMLIAAHAKAEGAILVTNNTREFARVEGLVLEDWTQNNT